MGDLAMRVYLDNCCFNRPFDDQSQARIRLEAEAKIEVQQRIKDGRIELAWSYMVEYENRANPFAERRSVIERWKKAAAVDVAESAEILRHARAIAESGVRAKDALHIASAIAAGCDFFLTTDDDLVKKMHGFSEIVVTDPTRFIIEVS
jgi:predicted nucleic acid-binding protein